MLTSFQEAGTIPEALTRNRDDWSGPVREIRDAYIRHCEETFKTHATQRSRISAADRFMRIVIVNKRIAWEDVSAKIISEYAKVSNLYISQIKRKCGIGVGKNYNLPKAEDSRQPQCPPEKEKAIRESFKYFGMI